MKILITGSSGFVGHNLVDYFSTFKTYSLLTPSSKALNLLDAGAVEKYLKRHKPDVVIHCASDVPTRDNFGSESQILHNNLMMFFSLSRCHKLYKRMFYFGSGAEYDSRHYKPHMREEYFDTHVPIDEYGFSKYVCSQYAGLSDNIYDLRLFGCFGPHERWQVRFISQSICKAIFDLDIEIGQNVRFDYLYVKDLGLIVESLFTKQRLKYHHYNICTGASIDLLSIAKMVREASGKNIVIKLLKKGMKKEYSGDNKRLRSEIKNLKLTPLPAAIEELFEWYDGQKKNINKKELVAAL